LIVVLTEEAEADLESVGDYIAKDNPGRAISFVRELRLKCESLADHPQRFPLNPRYENSGVRRCIHGNYLIFYRVKADLVEITHVLNGAVNYEPLLFPEG
jgi:plasmid stabilization system protein ParE